MAPTLAYTPLEKLAVPSPVDRVEYIRRQCAGKTVLDLGALDETAYSLKRGKGTWVHEEIAEVATCVVGIDSSAAIPDSGLRTGPRSTIYRGDVCDLQGFLAQHPVPVEVVVAGELIEHVANPLAFLRSIRNPGVLHGRTLIVTTPNATALHNCLVALASRESAHPDHLCILSYKTLNTLLLRSGFKDWQLLHYYARFTEMKERQAGLRRTLVGVCESIVNGAEHVWPLLSFGLIANVTI